MKPGHIESRAISRDAFSGDSIEGERGGIDDACAGRAERNDFARHQRSREQTYRTSLHQFLAAHGNQVWRAGAGANEVYGHAISVRAAAAVAWRSAEMTRATIRRASTPATA